MIFYTKDKATLLQAVSEVENKKLFKDFKAIDFSFDYEGIKEIKIWLCILKNFLNPLNTLNPIYNLF